MYTVHPDLNQFPRVFCKYFTSSYLSHPPPLPGLQHPGSKESSCPSRRRGLGGKGSLQVNQRGGATWICGARSPSPLGGVGPARCLATPRATPQDPR